MTIKVIGAGFGRTGTSSLQVALEELGFAKCYHMREVFANPEHVPIWQAASEGKPVDWDALFAGYQATVDWPGCAFYQELMQRYPDAKVLLSVRDPNKWYTSAFNTIYGGRHRGSFWSRLIELRPHIRRMLRMGESIIWQGTFHGKFEDEAYAIEVFNRHNAEVQRIVPPERLLVYNVKQGWEPLCGFLDVPVPETPFPHLNDSAEFQRMRQRRIRKAQLTFGIVLALVALILGWLARIRQQRLA
jgi:hypothetical protein